MITDKDIEKMKKVFATKDDLRAFATKDDLRDFAKKDDLGAFATKEDLRPFAMKDDLKMFPTKKEMITEIKKESNRLIDIMTHEFKTVIEMIGEAHTRIDETNRRMDKRFEKVDRRFDEVMDELRHNRIILTNHESRLQQLEQSHSAL